MDEGKTILHADMDAFYAAVEQRDRPEWRGRPIIVGGAGPRGVVATASYEARVFGVRSAMPGAQARRLCPEGIFVAPRMEVYAAEAATVRRVFEAFTPLVEPLSLDEAFLDVTGSRRLLGDGPTIARRLKDEVRAATGLTVSVGAAPCKYAAKVASDLDKPDGLVVVPADGVAEFLAPLPVARLWGAGPVLQRRLAGLGIGTIGDVQRLGREALEELLGAHLGEHFHRLSLGDDPRPVDPGHEARSIGHERTFGTDLEDRDACHGVLLELSEQVGRRLRRAGLEAATVRIKVRHGDFTTFSRQRRVAPTADDLVLHRTAAALFDGLWPGTPGIRLLGVAAAGLRAARGPRQGRLFGDDEGRQERLHRALDRIRDRFGEDAIRRAGRRPGD